MAQTPPPISQISSAALLILYRQALEGSAKFEPEVIAETFLESRVSGRQVQIALTALNRKHLAQYTVKPDGTYMWEISDVGYEYVDTEIRDSDSFLGDLFRKGELSALSKTEQGSQIGKSHFGTITDHLLLRMLSVQGDRKFVSPDGKWNLSKLSTGAFPHIGQREFESILNDMENRGLVSLDSDSSDPDGSFTWAYLNEAGFERGSALQMAQNKIVPAADRYVSVADNQSEFEEISQQLQTIKSELEKDHNKGDNQIDNLSARLADIESFETQVDGGWVSSTQALNLKETLNYLASVCKSSATIIASIGTIITTLTVLFTWIV